MKTHNKAEPLPPGISIASFSEGYRKHFEVVPAVTDSLKWHNYHIRHEVYAREFGWKPVREDNIETDDHDRHSLHCLIRTVASHAFVGGARLVLTDPHDPTAPLPFETACAHALDRGIVDPGTMDRSRIGEISRLVVVADYRRRSGETDTAFAIDDDFGIAPRIRLPYLTLGLYFAVLALARWKKLSTLFALTEPSVVESVESLGLKSIVIGAPIDHHGQRIPTMVDVEGVVTGLADYLRPFFATISDEVDRAMQATDSH